MLRRGLSVPLASPAVPVRPMGEVITDEAALVPPEGVDFRVEPLVAEGDLVAQGAPVLRSRRTPEVVLTAPMPGRVARIELGAGRRLTQFLMFHEAGAGRHDHPIPAREPAAIRRALLAAGLWPLLRSRPFGHFPDPGETPAAIFVMALDTRPLAPDPRTALIGQECAFAYGLEALSYLTQGPVHLIQDQGRPLTPGSERLRVHHIGGAHPAGLAGGHVLRLHPARLGAPVWDIAAEDVAAIGALMHSGQVPATRLVSVAGPGLREARLLRTQPGADLRALTQELMTPGARQILTGSVLDGHESPWLGARDRQVTVLPRPPAPDDRHWFRGALARASRPVPLIPTAALEQSLGPGVAVVPLLRALAAGDGETAARLGALSLVAEDLALADYVTGAAPSFGALHRGLLHRIEQEEGA